MNMEAFLQFGGAAFGGGPMQTVGVDIQERLLPWQVLGLQYTQSGYGRQIPSPYVIKWNGRWRRVYIACYGNASTCYIKQGSEWLATVDIYTTDTNKEAI